MRKLLVILVMLSFYPEHSDAQSPFFRLHPLTAPFSEVTVELLYEDPQRWIWVGTDGGLFQYDGRKFTAFLKKDSTSERVTAIYEDPQSRLWVGYEDGSIYYLDKEQLQPWQPEEGWPAVPVIGFLSDSENRLWIGTYGEGIYYYERGRMYNFDTDDGLLGNDLYCMSLDGHNRVWVGSDRGISICSLSNDEKQVSNLTRNDGLPDDIVRSITADAAGNFWLGFYDHGFCYYDLQRDTVTYAPNDWSYGVVNALEIIEERELWIGTDTRGVLRYDFADQSLSPIDGLTGLTNSKIHDLHKDREGNLWGVSNHHGIFSANRQFAFLSVPFDKIQALYSDSRGCLWIGTETGLYSYRCDAESAATYTQQLPELELNVLSLFEDTFGNIWIGTFGQGIFCYNPGSGQLRNITEKDGLTNGSVLSINGTAQKVWLATLGGVTEISSERNVLTNRHLSFKNYNHEDGLGTNFIYTVFIDSKERAWFATDGKGISLLENGKIRNYSRIAYQTQQGEVLSMDLKAVYSITEDEQGHIWFSTARDGIFEFDGRQFRHFDLEDGIGNLAITSLIRTANDHILVVHPAGIDLLNPRTYHLISYGAEVGISGLDPNLNACSRDQNGRVWIADQDGIVEYIPPVESMVVYPEVQLTEVSVDYQPVSRDGLAAFSYDQNNFVFEYTGLWYTNPTMVKYRYRLHGYDHDWIESRDQTATYSNLPPGEYTFAVTGTLNQAWGDEPIESYSFTIHPPIWERSWFVILCAVLGLSLFYWYQLTHDRRIRRLSALEKEKVESQLAALKAQINPHFLFNSFNTLMDTIEEDPDKAIEYVEKLSDFYRSVLKYKDDELIPIQEELQLVKNFSFLLNKRFGNNFALQLAIDHLVGYIPPLTLQLLVENALKHNIVSKARPLLVRIYQQEADYISVSNNLQPKSRTEDSTHFGLHGLSKRYDLLGKHKLKISTEGRHFTVSVPIIEKRKL